MRLFDRLRRPAPAADPAARRQFFRRMSGAALAAAAAGTLGADDAWAAVEERANAFGIVPGTVVDAQGRPVRGSRPGTEPLVGEIGIFAGNFAPRGYAFCQGQLMSINQNQALFAILGVTYGGDGQATFALPDLQGRIPLQPGQGPGLSPITLGERGGSENVTLNADQLPGHIHGVSGTLPVSSAPGTTPNPVGAVIAQPASSIPQYVTTVPAGTEGTIAVGGATTSAGGSQPHAVRNPYLGINYIIALVGIFPSRD